ncbi:hypothetical protein EDB81DRAFT_50270 [Dactylonectria macrodidyma]|uniref:C2H2-type domain-containing protein n=1 Tax=Dactylonectria macrodidyma TaxID=307937 RepID=A0A9P9FV47_9HYPO|nr:hypothetical protein EDB81DRAFT_50270 [Dactylonectria macrodidyma]
MEATPEDTASLNKLAQDCETRLRTIAQEEEAQQGATKPKDGTWASHQAIEFSLWCTKVGVHSEGRRSVDIRLKDVPEICDILRNLLQALRCDLEELQRPPEPIVQVEGDEHNAEDGDSDGSSLSFDSLTSSDDSRMRDSTDDVDKRKIKLRDHIEDTIDRLHGHERQIENSGAKHRQERVKLYCEKEGPSWAFNGYKELATRKANDEFKLASDTIKKRIAESFARRRIRFEYLERHQKKRAAVIVAPKPLPLAPQLAPADGSSVAIKKPIVPEKPSNTPMRRILQDQRTIYSATENTKLVMRPGSKLPERAESVASVALRHIGFPPPPRVTDGVFQCPYCRLEFRAREAEKARWIQHVMQDFEPYFCIAEDCKTPFDVPNSFNGLLGHLQEHLPLTWHADLPGGETKEFDDEGLFTNYVIEHGGVSGDALTILKETSLRRTAFLFVTCPFCGGYPDVLEKNHPDPAQPEAQLALRRHIKQHMHDIALFLPPYRDDILEDCGDFNSSAVTRRRSIDANNSSESSKQPTICDNEDCDCKDWEKDFTDHDLISQDPPVDIDFWPTLLRDSGLYDRSAGLDEDWEFDTCLKPFVTRFLDKPDDLNDAYLSTTSELPKFTVVSLEEEHDETGPMTTESIAHLLPLSFFRTPPVSAIRPPETYTIAWVCSLRDSFTAAKMFLDEEHRNSHPEERNSDNPQTMGRIGRHNVVIIFWNSLLGIRTQDITDMFPNVQIRLVVDIAGGVPSTNHDIRLGDVVVSGGEDPDMKGLLHCADYRTRASMTLPSEFLEELLPGLEHALKMSRQQCEAVIRAVLKGNLQDEENFGHPHPESDVLYKPDVVHYRVDGQPCIEKHGDDASQIICDSAIDQNSAVHYGLVAFGHLLRQGVRRDRKLRDQIIDNNPVLCIERVTSFVEGEFPDLVIHGICDYSDGHQYPEWEGYAAMAAATYASNLIRRLPALPTEEEEHTVASNETPAGHYFDNSY